MTRGALGTTGNLHRLPGVPIKGQDGSGTPGLVSGRGTDRFCISLFQAGQHCVLSALLTPPQ